MSLFQYIFIEFTNPWGGLGQEAIHVVNLTTKGRHGGNGRWVANLGTHNLAVLGNPSMVNTLDALVAKPNPDTQRKNVLGLVPKGTQVSKFTVVSHRHAKFVVYFSKL